MARPKPDGADPNFDFAGKVAHAKDFRICAQVIKFHDSIRLFIKNGYDWTDRYGPWQMRRWRSMREASSLMAR